jgi:hypothetical protein
MTIKVDRQAKETMMARKPEVTSRRAASAAAKVLSNPRSSAAAKTAATSALTQRPNRTRKK